MKISKILHVLTVIVGVFGVSSLFSAWNFRMGYMIGFSETHMFGDTVALFLCAIWLQLGAIHHMKLEEKGEMI